MQIETHSVQQTLALGRLIGWLAPPTPAVTCIALDGLLGAGKTHLTRGIAWGARVADLDVVSSPTYVLMNIYQGDKPIYHFDAYRVESADAFDELGFAEIASGSAGGGGGGILVVEWAQRVAAVMPSDTLWVQI